MTDGRDPARIDLHRTRAWLSQEVEIRVPRLWLALGLVLIVVLLVVALD